MRKQLKCALIGYGYWGKIIEKYLLKSDYIDLMYIYDPCISNIISLDSILLNQDIDAVFICTPIETHYKLVKNFLNHGHHVFCEKPLTKSYREAKELEKLAFDRNLCLYTDYIYTVSPSINYLKNNLKSIGEIKKIEGEILQFGNFYKNDSVEVVLGVHLISAILYILNGEKKDIKLQNTIVIRHEKEIVLENQFEILVPPIPKIILKCSLLSETKTRIIKFEGKKGNLVFDMLGFYTAKQFLIKKEEIGYSILRDYGIKFDESNNLVGVIEQFYNEVIDGKIGNIELSLAVTNIIEQFNIDRQVE